jgi:uncharacterized glyoxalase superfamily protein PhnB
MQITNYYPVLAMTDVSSACAFFQQHLGFVPGYVTDWYIHLVHPAHPTAAVGLIAKNHETTPAEARVSAAGLILSFEVENVDAVHARLKETGAPIYSSPKDEPWGQRHFMVCGPDGVLLDIIQPIPPSVEYASAYVGDAP